MGWAEEQARARQEQEQSQQQRQAWVERMIGDPLEFAAHDATGCPKCGLPKEAIAKKFCYGKQALHPEFPCSTEGQHLHTVCQGCGFLWLERCKDWKPDDERPRLETAS